MANSGKYVNAESTYSAHEWHMNLGDDSFMFDPFENTTLDWVSHDPPSRSPTFYRKLIELLRKALY
jgi:hypothetical protein